MIPGPETLTDWLALGIGLLAGFLASVPAGYAAAVALGYRRRYRGIVDYEPVDDYEPVITIESRTTLLLETGGNHEL